MSAITQRYAPLLNDFAIIASSLVMSLTDVLFLVQLKESNATIAKGSVTFRPIARRCASAERRACPTGALQNGPIQRGVGRGMPGLRGGFVGYRGGMAGSPRSATCYKCGGPNHYARDCQAQAMKCYACGKLSEQTGDANPAAANSTAAATPSAAANVTNQPISTTAAATVVAATATPTAA
ncbi:MAG: hypothetical protein M1825_005416 [Sarcosagium campestre]|nr:MAG: hypothetical protein M1825_005416 [Sarcosagium campestre]